MTSAVRPEQAESRSSPTSLCRRATSGSTRPWLAPRSSSPRRPAFWRHAGSMAPLASSSRGGSLPAVRRFTPTPWPTHRPCSPVMACSLPGRCSIASDRYFSRARIVAALQALGDELTSQGVRGQIFVVGGAAMALAYSTRRVTKDIDAVFEPKAVIYTAAARVAEQLGLPGDWLNDAVKGFLPGPDEDSRPVPNIRGLEVTTASPRYLLALKLMAMRFGEDDEDIELLLKECGCAAPREALDLLQHL